MIGNMGWLVAHAPGADYVWLLGDDDLPEPGIVGEIVAEIESSRPALASPAVALGECRWHDRGAFPLP